MSRSSALTFLSSRGVGCSRLKIKTKFDLVRSVSLDVFYNLVDHMVVGYDRVLRNHEIRASEFVCGASLANGVDKAAETLKKNRGAEARSGASPLKED